MQHSANSLQEAEGLVYNHSSKWMHALILQTKPTRLKALLSKSVALYMYVEMINLMNSYGPMIFSFRCADSWSQHSHAETS